jgi:hypothetical protein
MAQKHKVRHAGPIKPQMCGGKRCYNSNAEATLVKEENELLTDGLELSTYQCITCGKWHLTRQAR